MKPPSTDPAVKRSISMPASLYHAMQARMRSLGIKSESVYLQTLIHQDVTAGGPFVRTPTAPGFQPGRLDPPSIKYVDTATGQTKRLPITSHVAFSSTNEEPDPPSSVEKQPPLKGQPHPKSTAGIHAAARQGRRKQ